MARPASRSFCGRLRAVRHANSNAQPNTRAADDDPNGRPHARGYPRAAQRDPGSADGHCNPVHGNARSTNTDAGTAHACAAHRHTAATDSNARAAHGHTAAADSNARPACANRCRRAANSNTRAARGWAEILSARAD